MSNNWRPTSRRLYEREVNRNMRLHRKRLANIKASVNMKKPKSLKKKRSTAKREQALREREDAIEYENQILIGSLIYAKPTVGFEVSQSGAPFHLGNGLATLLP